MKTTCSSLSFLLALSFITFLSKTSLCQTINTSGTNYALVVGISSYPNINQLLYADDDAELFADYLRIEGVCYKKNISLLIDSAATTANFYRELNKIRNKIKPNDKVFIYFAGHGDVESDLESGFLLTYNCEKNNYAATSIDIAMLERYVNSFVNKQANVILITDACRSGSLAGGLAGATITLSSLTKGFNSSIKLLSCQPNQLSQEKSYFDGGHGVFTYHLVDALKGLADKNNDNLISLRELDLYLDSVSLETKQKQIPRVDGNPVSIISSYKDTVKTSLITQKKNKHQSVFLASREVNSNDYDSNFYYKTFIEHIRNRRLIFPNKNNALTTIENAILQKQNTALIEDMKIELVAVIEDEVQKDLNKFLRGELAFIKNNSDEREYVNQTKRNSELMNVCLSLTNTNDLHYNVIKAKQLYYKSILIHRENNKKLFPLTLRDMIIADSIMPNQPFIINNIATIYDELGYDSLAELSYHNCIKLAPSWKVSLSNLGAFYSRRNLLKQSEFYLKRALELDSNFYFALSDLVQVFLMQSKNDEAKILIDKMLTLDSTYIRAWLWKFNFCFGAGDYSQAEHAFLKAFSIDSLDSYVWLAKGSFLYFHKKDFAGAEKAYLKSIDLDSIILNPEAWNMIGQIRIDNKEYENAKLAYSKAVSIDTLNYGSWLGLGNATMMLNDLKKAEECYLYCSKIYPEASLAWYNLACLNIKFGNKDIALYYFEEALKKGYLDFNYFEKDTDLDGVRNDVRYQKLIKKYKKKTVAN